VPRVNPRIRFVQNPYGEGQVAVVPPLRPDVAILHAQRADHQCNTQAWGILGVQREAAFAADHVLIVDAVVHEPFGAHPSYVQGYYDRDNAFYREWDALSRDPDSVGAWLESWVYGVQDRGEYLAKLSPGTLERFRPSGRTSDRVDYGDYR